MAQNDIEVAELELIKPGKFDIQNFDGDLLRENSEKVLMALLGMQSNQNPLKKGGPEIAFRCDALILLNRQTYNSNENTLFDVICGCVSSRPDDAIYTIYVKDLKKYFDYADNSYIYQVVEKAMISFKKKNELIFPVVTSNDKVSEVSIPWYDLLQYTKSSESDLGNTFISFKPTPFFKMLLVSATITHGAFYSIKVSSKIQSQYARNLYYILESRKKYKESINGEAGNFKISLDDFRKLINYPESYNVTKMRTRVLDEIRNSIKENPECDFMFDYKLLKAKDVISGSTKYAYIEFKIYSKKEVFSSLQKEEKINEKDQMKEVEKNTLKMMLQSVDMTDEDRDKIIKKYFKNNRDIKFMTEALITLSNYKGAKSKSAVLQSFMENGFNSVNEGNTEVKEDASSIFNRVEKSDTQQEQYREFIDSIDNKNN